VDGQADPLVGKFAEGFERRQQGYDFFDRSGPDEAAGELSVIDVG